MSGWSSDARKARSLIRQANEYLESASSAADERLSSLSDRALDGPLGERLEEAQSSIEEAIGYLDMAADELDELFGKKG